MVLKRWRLGGDERWMVIGRMRWLDPSDDGLEQVG